jgi:hypothetical protein
MHVSKQGVTTIYNRVLTRKLIHSRGDLYTCLRNTPRKLVENMNNESPTASADCRRKLELGEQHAIRNLNVGQIYPVCRMWN